VYAPVATAWSARRSVHESPSAAAGSSSSNRRSAGARNGSCSVLCVAHSASAVGSRFGCGMTAWRRLSAWQQAGVWEKLHQLLLAELHSPTEGGGWCS
jgi:hypothetical protein